MRILRKVIALCSAALTSTVLASPVGAEIMPDHWHFLLGLSGGPTWTQAGENQTFFLQPDVQKTYAANKNSQEFVSGEFLLGLQKNLNPYVTGQFGIAIADANATKLNGDIWEDADPAFNNFTYAYKINHVNVAMKGRIISNTSYYGIQPYVSGSIGVGFNRAYDFSITPTISEEIPAPPFSSNTKTALSFTLGAGIQKSLFDNWQVGIGYEFADWGSYSLGRAAGQTVNQGLSLNHVYVQQLQFTVIYIK